MELLLTFDYPSVPFKTFSLSHIVALSLILLCCILITAFREKLRNSANGEAFRYILGAALLLQGILAQVWMVFSGHWSLTASLPLHLCGVSAFLSVYMLFYKSYTIYEIAYFWGLGGAVQALLTPDLGPFSYPHLFFYQFFISHGLIVLASVYMTAVLGYSPTHRSVWKTFSLTNAYALFIGLFNQVTGSNYLYLCHKPGGPSLLDLLGPWPWYILWLELVLIIMCYIYYLPFAISEKLHNRRISG